MIEMTDEKEDEKEIETVNRITGVSTGTKRLVIHRTVRPLEDCEMYPRSCELCFEKECVVSKIIRAMDELGFGE